MYPATAQPPLPESITTDTAAAPIAMMYRTRSVPLPVSDRIMHRISTMTDTGIRMSRIPSFRSPSMENQSDACINRIVT